MSKLIHLVHHKTNLDLYFEILMKFKRIFVKGGIKRMKYSIPALCFALFRLSNELVNKLQGHGEEEVKEEPSGDDEIQVKLPKLDHNKLFKLVHELIQ